MVKMVMINLLLLLVTIDGILSQEGPIISTTLGDVEGSRKTDQRGRRYDEFLGIPYGAPPEGDLRWEKPEVADPWLDVWNATVWSPHCIQTISLLHPIIGIPDEDSEDCLHLNVWVPNGTDSARGLPVMVWYYGGGYIVGASGMYPGNELACLADVVVVSMNYRVGPMGFLHTGDEAAPGNYGLWDGVLALQWVRDNIASFGGDPTRVTIFGNSAGGGMVVHTMLSPEARGLFQNVIAHSGGAINSGTPHMQNTHWLAEQFGCPTEDSAIMIECLRDEDADDIDMWTNLIPLIQNGTLIRFGPVIEGEFIPRPPEDAYRAGAAGPYNFITGRTYHDSAGFVLGNLFGWNMSSIPELNQAHTLNSTEEFLRAMLSAYPDVDRALGLVIGQYPNVTSEDNTTRTQALVRLVTDRQFGVRSHLEAGLHAHSGGGSGRTYLYEYQYRNSFLRYDQEWVNGSHIEELYSIFGESLLEWMRRNLLEAEWNADDFRTLNNMVNYWHNFAYNSNPSEGRTVPAAWPQYNNGSKMMCRLTPYMSRSSMEKESEDLLRRYKFWSETMRLPRDQDEEDIRPLQEFSLEEAQAQILPYLEQIGMSQLADDHTLSVMQATVAASYYRVQQRREENLKKWNSWQ